MEQIKLKAYSKLNLSLSVGKRESDGYHQVHSLIVPIDLSDVVTVALRPDGIIRLDCPGIPDQRNTALKAARAFCDYFAVDGADIKIEKRIPIGGGLGGSSADAAAVLNALAVLHNIDDQAGLYAIGEKIGKDVPAMLAGQAVIVGGRGEQFQPIELSCDMAAVVIESPVGNDTALIYATFDDLMPSPVCNTQLAFKLLDRLNANDLHGATAFMKNDLALAAYAANPEMSRIRDELFKCGYPVFVTGSGSAQFILAKNYPAAFAIAKRLSARYKVYPVKLSV